MTSLKDRFGSLRSTSPTQQSDSQRLFTIALCFTLALVATQFMLMLTCPLALTPPQPPMAGYLLHHWPFFLTGFYIPAFILLLYLEDGGLLSGLQEAVMRRLVYTGAVFAILTSSFGSIDFYDYIAYGYKLADLHRTPFTPLFTLGGDPIIGKVPNVWWNLPSFYGPTAVLYFAFLAELVPADFQTLQVMFKLGWLAAFIGYAQLTQRLLKDQKLPFIRWFTLCGNPAMWVECLRDAHAEMLILVVFAGAIFTLQQRRWGLTGIVLAMMASVKLIMLAIVPFFVWQAFILPDGESRWERARWVLFGFIAYMAPVYILFGGGEFRGLMHNGLTLQNAPQLINAAYIKVVNAWPFGTNEIENDEIPRQLSNLTLLASLAFLFLWTLQQKGRANFHATTSIALILVLLTRAWSQPWYFFWFMLPLTLISRTPRAVFFLNMMLLGFAAHNRPFTGVAFFHCVATAVALIWLFKKLLYVPAEASGS